MFYVYILRSLKVEKSYTGFTSKNPKERLKEHNSGANRWTKNNGPFSLVYFEKYYCKRDARSRELFFKSGVGKKLILDNF